ncbi:DUF4189 domain-containing protein [Pseudomonas sp. F1_0610]|uniref:DUF4189 domain-containing protein n=1 Tax=Pseudomonas sp. F1_0610 TaxID=3114284 RepID=UPI0039C0C691
MRKFGTILLVFSFLFISNNALAQKFWGAVYINKQTGITGASWNWEGQSEAENEALKHCKIKNSGKQGECQFVQAFYNGCISIYWSSITKNYGWGFNGHDMYIARMNAVSGCSGVGGKQCKEILNFCTARYY